MNRNISDAIKRSPATLAPTAIPMVLPVLFEEWPEEDLAAITGVEDGSKLAVELGTSEEVVGTGVVFATGGGPAVFVELRTLIFYIC
jgi:hypothetical protein